MMQISKAVIKHCRAVFAFP